VAPPRLVQGSHLPLSWLGASALQFLCERLVPCVEGLSEESILEKIKGLAERKLYGIKDKNANLFEDQVHLHGQDCRQAAGSRKPPTMTDKYRRHRPRGAILDS
jgi:hypothetical protein